MPTNVLWILQPLLPQVASQHHPRDSQRLRGEEEDLVVEENEEEKEEEDEKEKSELITSSNGTDEPILLPRGIRAHQPQPRRPPPEEVLDDTEASRDDTDDYREAKIVIDTAVVDEQAGHPSALHVTARTELFLSEMGYCRDILLALIRRHV